MGIKGDLLWSWLYGLHFVLLGMFANNKNRSGIGWGILSFIFSPLLAGVVLACLKDLGVEEDINKVKMEHQHLKDRVVFNEKITEHRLNRVESDVNKLGSSQNKISNKMPQNKMLSEDNKLCPACAEIIKSSAICAQRRESAMNLAA